MADPRAAMADPLPDAVEAVVGEPVAERDQVTVAQEDADRAKAAAAQAETERAQRAEQARIDEEKRQIEEAKRELLATDRMIGVLAERIKGLPQYAGIAKAIAAYIAKATS